MALCLMAIVAANGMAQTTQLWGYNTIQIASASGSNYMQFPNCYSFDYKNANDDIVRKIFVGWSINADKKPAAGRHIISTNSGQSYGSVSPAAESPIGFVSVIKMNNGTMLNVPFKATVAGHTGTIRYSTSTDNGETWDTTHVANINFGAATVTSLYFHRGIFEDDGALYATVYASHGSGLKPMILKSSDSGANWAPWGAEIGASIGYTETTVARCANGDWLAVYKAGPDYFPLKYSRSTNKGVTWSPEAYLPGLDSAHTPADDRNEGVDPFLQLMPNGVLVLSYGRPNLHLAISPDGNGNNWIDTITTFKETPGTPGRETTGYSTVIPTGPNSFLQFGDTGADWQYAGPYSSGKRHFKLFALNKTASI